MVTGDDVLIEYVWRILNCLKNLSESWLGTLEKSNFEKFITHYVWTNKDSTSATFYDWIGNRYSEMVTRRRKLLKSTIKKELIEAGKMEESENSIAVDQKVFDREDKK